MTLTKAIYARKALSGLRKASYALEGVEEGVVPLQLEKALEALGQSCDWLEEYIDTLKGVQ